MIVISHGRDGQEGQKLARARDLDEAETAIKRLLAGAGTPIPRTERSFHSVIYVFRREGRTEWLKAEPEEALPHAYSLQPLPGEIQPLPDYSLIA